MSRPSWSVESLPDQHGRRVLITGPTAGLGYWAAEQLASRGATVVLAARSPEKVRATEASIRSRVPDADISSVPLDLADLSDVARAADDIRRIGRIDALILNAGVLSSRHRDLTVDGHERMFGTNHLGHFALTAHLLPHLVDGRSADDPARIVHLGSIAHRFTRLALDDLDGTDYQNFRAYCRSKLAVMLFGFELATRLGEAAAPVSSIIAHPGFAIDELSPFRPALATAATAPAPLRAVEGAFAQGKDAGAWPIVAAAASPAAQSGSYWGPGGWEQLKGAPKPVRAKAHAHDRAVASSLIAASEQMTGTRLGF